MRARVSVPSSADGMYQFVGLGYCALTSSIPSSCRDDDKGSWPLPPLASSTNAAAELACSTMCAPCANCHYISYSLRAQECSWFASCGRLKTDVNGFSTIRVVKGGQSRSAFVAVSLPSPALSKRAAADHEAFGSFLGKVSAGAPGYCEATEFHGEYWQDRARIVPASVRRMVRGFCPWRSFVNFQTTGGVGCESGPRRGACASARRALTAVSSASASMTATAAGFQPARACTLIVSG